MFNTHSIKNKLVVIILLVTTITSFIAYSAFVSWYLNDQYNKTIKLAHTISSIISQDIAKFLLLNDVSAAADISSNLKSFKNLTSMVLYNQQNTPMLQYNKDNITKKLPKLNKNNFNTKIQNNSLKTVVPTIYQETLLGNIKLDFKILTIKDIIKRDIVALISIFLFVILLSYILAQYFAKKFTNPILNLVNFLEKVELNDISNKRIPNKEKDENAKLYNEINKMLERIEVSHNALKLAAVAFETQSGTIITDKNQKILKVNKSFTRITGYLPNEVIGFTPSKFKSGLHSDEFYTNMYTSLKRNNFWIGEISNTRKDGSIVNEHLTIQAVTNTNNEVVYYIASFIDITLIKEMEKKLKENEAFIIQQSKMAAMGEMIENIAHQWRQPLSTITSSASGIQLQKEFNLLSDELLDESVEIIINSAKHLSQTIDDFRSFYSNKKEKNSFNIKNSIDKALKLISSKLVKNNIIVLINHEDLYFYGLENELIQVYMNILSNAKDVLEDSKEVAKIIKIEIKSEKENILISFCDNGGGIPNNIINKIFENYFTTKSKKDGTGIGLHMSKLIIEKANGSLLAFNTRFEYQNKFYEGACFEIKLPRFKR